MKTILTILILAFVVSSCKKDDPVPHFVSDDSVYITVTGKDGTDLFNPSNPGAFLARDIKIFYLIDGVKEEVYYPNYEFPRNFYIDNEAESDGKFWMTLFLNASEDEAYPVTYIQWNENDTDTLKCDVFRADGIVSVMNIWLNDSLAWKSEDYAKESRKIRIIK